MGRSTPGSSIENLQVSFGTPARLSRLRSRGATLPSRVEHLGLSPIGTLRGGGAGRSRRPAASSGQSGTARGSAGSGPPGASPPAARNLNPGSLRVRGGPPAASSEGESRATKRKPPELARGGFRGQCSHACCKEATLDTMQQRAQRVAGVV